MKCVVYANCNMLTHLKSDKKHTYLKGELETADVNVETVTGGQEHLCHVCQFAGVVHCHVSQVDTVQVLQSYAHTR